MKKKNKKEMLFAYSWSAPSLILILLIVIFPILYTGYISLTNMNVYHWNNYALIGLKNYKDALLVLDNGFIQAFLVTILWTVVNMVLQLIIAFLLANLLNLKRLRLRNVYKTLLIFPWAMPGYVSILLWKTGMFNSQFGLLNQWLAIFMLYHCKPLAGTSVYDNNYGWCSAKYRKEFLRKCSFRWRNMVAKNVVYYDSDDKTDYCTIGCDYDVYNI